MKPKSRIVVPPSVAGRIATSRALVEARSPAGPSMAVRTPELLIPVAPATPPLAAPPPTANASGGIGEKEIIVGPFKWEDFLSGSRRVVCATSRSWRGIDCYLTPPASVMTAGDAIHVRVYAIAQGLRALVATGFYAASVINAGNVFDARPVRVCAARAIAERFEVEVMFVGSGAVGTSTDASVIAIAHNEAIDVPRALGAWGPLASLDPVPSPYNYDGIRLLGVRSVNNGAATGYALVIDKRGPIAAGDAAKFSFPVPPGQTIDAYPLEADHAFFARGFELVNSTTPDVVTLGATMVSRAWIR